MKRIAVQKIVVTLLVLWALGFHSLLLFVLWSDHVARAIALMALGLLLLWGIGLGALMWRKGEMLACFVNRLPMPWRLRFILLATLLALTEEAIATSMTNLAPLFGDASGQAAITASPNYLEVVSSHSVIVFIPMFLGWAVVLSWRSFSPFAVFLLFGITGLIGEVISFGPQNFAAGGFWVLVYGLMVYLPALTVPVRSIPQARLWHYPIAVLLPVAFAVPIVMMVLWISGASSP